MRGFDELVRAAGRPTVPARARPGAAQLAGRHGPRCRAGLRRPRVARGRRVLAAPRGRRRRDAGGRRHGNGAGVHLAAPDRDRGMAGGRPCRAWPPGRRRSAPRARWRPASSCTSAAKRRARKCGFPGRPVVGALAARAGPATPTDRRRGGCHRRGIPGLGGQCAGCRIPGHHRCRRAPGPGLAVAGAVWTHGAANR